ncbi:di-heme oxidoredictase family protein [Roseibium aestuarii]|uniref:Di-heme oxidoredictase family protein n=1 Tax=Roseibium aestuarii TaxID=2600299 RepID=A0ABW4K2C8_9HYPH|nr:di-heme oxidoredictase family protein [Roseibium aestuarii]
MSASRLRRLAPRAAGPALAVLTLALASGARAEDPAARPWDERVLTEAIDYDALASDPSLSVEALSEKGRHLFEGRFIEADGAGRPEATQAIVPTKRRRAASHMFLRLSGLDANSCQSCHAMPVSGGAGDFTANVFVSEGFESADFDTTDPQFSNERGTTHLMGAGLIELLAREMTADLRAQRHDVVTEARKSGAAVTRKLETKGVSFGEITAEPDGRVDVSKLDGIDSDLTLRPFGQKGVFGSLRQFSVNALNQHSGIQPVERFGAAWTGTNDFDGDAIADELSVGQVSALVAFQATLPAPGRKTDLPEVWSTAAARGETLFSDIGCATCHRPSLPLDSLIFQDPNPFETAGTLRPEDVATPLKLDLATLDWVKALPKDDQGRTLVPLFGDLKRHRIADAARETLGNELLSQRFVARDVFITAELWGVGNTAPYGHRGDLTTLHDVIDAHGGEATEARKAYSALGEDDRQSIIAFLRTLEIGK